MALTTVKSDQIQTSVALAGSPTTTTQSASDNSTKLATTAYVETAVANLVDSAPASLNTLDELAAALNDDANFASTITTSIATKAPLAGAAFTGDTTITKESPAFTLTDSSSSRTLLNFVDDNNSVIRASGPLLIQSGGAVSAITLDASQNATFSGDVTADKYIMAGGSQIGQDYAYIKSASTTNASLTLRKDSTGADSIDFLQLRSDGNGLIGKIEGDGDISFKGATFTGSVGIGVTASAPLDVVTNSTVWTGEFTQSNTSNGDGVLISVGSTASADYALSVRTNAGAHSGLAVKADGNVGIGTFSPTTGRLQVKGAGTSSSTNAIFADNSSGAGLFAIRDNGEAFILGNTGIGTSSPSELLHIEKSSGTTLVKTEVASNSTIGFEIKKTGSTTSNWRIVDGQTANGKLEIYDVTNSRGVMTFDQNGNTGIGTASPVNNGTNSHGLTINGTGNYQNIALQKSGTTQFLVYLNGASGTFIDQITNDPMMFLTNDTERLRIGATGELQLGGTTNAGFVDFDGTSLQLNTQRNPNTGAFVNTSRAHAGITLSSASADSHIKFYTASANNTTASERMRITSTKIVNFDVREHYERIYIRGNTAYTWDIDVKSIGASGQILEIFAGWTHYATSYAAVLKQIWSHRSTVQSDVVLIQSLVNYTTSNAGAWSVSWVDADTIRLTKSAGSHGGYGWGYILVRGPD